MIVSDQNERECTLGGNDDRAELGLISRVKIMTNDELSFKLPWTQFPVQLGFSMTMNKS